MALDHAFARTPVGPEGARQEGLATGAPEMSATATRICAWRRWPHRAAAWFGHVTNHVIDDIKDGGMMRAVRRHPSEFRPETLRANAAIPGSARSVPGQRGDLAVFDPVNLMLDGEPSFRPPAAFSLVDGTFRGAGGNRTHCTGVRRCWIMSLHGR